MYLESVIIGRYLIITFILSHVNKTKAGRVYNKDDFKIQEFVTLKIMMGRQPRWNVWCV